MWQGVAWKGIQQVALRALPRRWACLGNTLVALDHEAKCIGYKIEECIGKYTRSQF
jgi:hypothetical protein